MNDIVNPNIYTVVMNYTQSVLGSELDTTQINITEKGKTYAIVSK